MLRAREHTGDRCRRRDHGLRSLAGLRKARGIGEVPTHDFGPQVAQGHSVCVWTHQASDLMLTVTQPSDDAIPQVSGATNNEDHFVPPLGPDASGGQTRTQHDHFT